MILSSSAVEHPAVNRRVVGSNPTWGAIHESPRHRSVGSFLLPGCSSGPLFLRATRVRDDPPLPERKRQAWLASCHPVPHGAEGFVYALTVRVVSP